MLRKAVMGGWSGHLGSSQMHHRLPSSVGDPGRERGGLGNVEGCWEEVGEKVGGGGGEFSLTFVCNLASCFSSRLVCL